MVSEAKMILKMFEEGKITLEEAQALLEAIGIGDNATPKDTVEDSITDADRPKAEISFVQQPILDRKPVVTYVEDDAIDNLIDEVEDGFDQMSDQLDEIEDVLDEQLDELDDQIDTIDDTEELGLAQRAYMKERVKEAKDHVEERRSRLKERRAKLEEQEREYINKCQSDLSIGEEIRRSMDELSRNLEDMRIHFELEGKEEIKRIIRDIKEEINAGIRDFRHGMNEGARGLRDGLNEGARELRNGLSEGAREVRKVLKGSDLKGILGNIFGSFSFGHWPGYTLEEEIIGNFDPVECTLIDIRTSNGRVEVIGSDREDYKLILQYEIAADNEADAKRLKNEMCRVTTSEGLLKVETTEHRHGAVSVKLLVPARLKAEYKLKSSNGRICISGLKTDGKVSLSSSNGRLEMTDLRLTEIHGHTSNGRVELKDFAAESIDLSSSNGSIYIDGICAQVVGKTSNGTITVYPRVTDEADLRLNTSNGRVKVVVQDPEIVVDLDVHSRMGGITLDFPELVYTRQMNQHGRKNFQAHSSNYDSQTKKLRIEAGTSMGSIYIGKSEM